jgi:hypothetical protein
VNRNATIRRSVLRGNRFGDDLGLELRSVSGNPARYRSTHRSPSRASTGTVPPPAATTTPVDDENSKTTTPLRRQRRVSVGHETSVVKMRVW